MEYPALAIAGTLFWYLIILARNLLRLRREEEKKPGIRCDASIGCVVTRTAQ
jgi:hypothetical protein